MQGIESLDNFKSFVSSLGGLGRFEDTYIVHAAEGETVVPMEVLDKNPALKKRLFKTMMDMGIEPGRYIVGNELNSKNPVTGQPEFFLKQIGRRLRKAAADISGYAAPIAGALFGAPAGAATGALLGQYKRENPGDPTQGMQMALRGGLTGLATNLATGQSPFSLGGGLAGRATELGKGVGMFDVFKEPGKFFLDKAEGGTGKSFIRNAMENFFNIGSGSSDSDTLSTLIDQFEKGNIDKDDFIKGLDKVGSGTAKANIIDALKAGVPLTLALGFLIDQTTDTGPVGAPIDPVTGEVITGILNPIGVSPSLPTRAEGGVMDLRQGGESEGPGTGTSDDIPAMLSDGEFVMTAKAVRGAGGGDRREGARKMYQAMDELEARA